jgi:signal transduction histidine kinase
MFPVSARPGGSGVVILLLLSVLVPSICLLWFMGQAIKSERNEAQQKLLDAYRGQITLAQERLENRIEQFSNELETRLNKQGPAAAFELAVRSNIADAAVCFDAAGAMVYPEPVRPPAPERSFPEWSEALRLEASDPDAGAKAFAEITNQSTNRTVAARARQAQIRCLLEAGEKEKALELADNYFKEAQFERERDPQNRLIVADLELVAIQFLAEKNPSRHGASSTNPPAVATSGGAAFATMAQQARIRHRLETRLEDYSGETMPASQRRFLMGELEGLFPDETKFPTRTAEELAGRVTQAAAVRPGEQMTLRPGPIPLVSQQGMAHGRVLLLHRGENLPARIASWIPAQSLPAGIRIEIIAPGAGTGQLLLPTSAAAALPGWRMGLAFKDKDLFRTAASPRAVGYILMGTAVFAAVTLLATLVLRVVRKQAALTQLKNDLVANVTHELKTPLSSMRLLVDTLLNSGELQEKTTREYLQLIASENARLSRLIDNFLTFSRIERNKYAFNFKPVPAQRIVEQSAAAVRDRFNVPGCKFQVSLPAGLPVIEADEDAMVTVLLNLLDNAFKYSGDDKQISLSAAKENGSIQFTVRDNGIGLLPRETNRIFNRFYQVDQRMTRVGGGCGLGLSIVQFIVNAHRGDIEVQSQPGAGSSFVVSLPIS